MKLLIGLLVLFILLGGKSSCKGGRSIDVPPVKEPPYSKNRKEW